MPIVRVKPDVCSVILDSATGEHVPLHPGDEFDSDDPIVKSFPWAFQSDAKATPRGRARSVRIEQATANPGEVR